MKTTTGHKYYGYYLDKVRSQWVVRNPANETIGTAFTLEKAKALVRRNMNYSIPSKPDEGPMVLRRLLGAARPTSHCPRPHAKACLED